MHGVEGHPLDSCIQIHLPPSNSAKMVLSRHDNTRFIDKNFLNSTYLQLSIEIVVGILKSVT